MNGFVFKIVVINAALLSALSFSLFSFAQEIQVNAKAGCMACHQGEPLHAVVIPKKKQARLVSQK
jgi:hypothetical protein